MMTQLPQELDSDSTTCTTHPWTVNTAFWPQNHILQSLKMTLLLPLLSEWSPHMSLHVTSIQLQAWNGSHRQGLGNVPMP